MPYYRRNKVVFNRQTNLMVGYILRALLLSTDNKRVKSRLHRASILEGIIVFLDRDKISSRVSRANWKSSERTSSRASRDSYKYEWNCCMSTFNSSMSPVINLKKQTIASLVFVVGTKMSSNHSKNRFISRQSPGKK